MNVTVYLILYTTVTIFNGTTTTGGVHTTTWFILWSHVGTSSVRIVGKHLCVRCDILVFTYVWMRKNGDTKVVILIRQSILILACAGCMLIDFLSTLFRAETNTNTRRENICKGFGNQDSKIGIKILVKVNWSNDPAHTMYLSSGSDTVKSDTNVNTLTQYMCITVVAYLKNCLLVESIM